MAATTTRSKSAAAAAASTSDKSNGNSAQPVEDVDAVHHEYEFGGPVGVVAMMTFFPSLFYYLYVCLYFYDGKLATPDRPTSLNGTGGWFDFVTTVVGLVRKHAAPTERAVVLYFSLIALQLLLAFVAPGVKQQGLPVSSLGGKTLTYHCNAYSALYITLAIVGGAHYTGLFHLAEIIDLYGPLLTIATLAGFAFAAVVYVLSPGYRMSGNVIYDYFMGASLNPRIGIVDIKMWCEIRVSWTILFMLALGGCAKQYEDYGYISPNLLLFTWGTGMYLNACAKGEQYIPQTWDMNFEKFGWLLSYWNLAGVPFSYGFGAVYMATHDPATYRYPTWVYVFLFVFLTTSHILFDVAMGQKSWFKAQETGTFIKRHTFPQIPGTELNNPKVIVTERGTKLLVDGLWGVVRKPNYTFDWFQAVVWGLSAGLHSCIPYFYPAFHITMLLHRNARDDARCARKYKKSWVEYQQRVPYSFIPYVW